MQQQIKLGATILIGISLLVGVVVFIVMRPTSPSVEPPNSHSELPIQGEQLFNNLGCAACHQANSTGLGPSLHGLYNQQVYLDDGTTILADDAYLYESILDPAAKVVKNYTPIMPTYQSQLKEDEVLQLVTYIKSLAE